MITRHVVKSCCGAKAFIFDIETPINRAHLAPFHDLGYVTPDYYPKAGIFYVQYQGLIATASFGTTKVHVRCNAKNVDQLLATFEQLLDELTHKV